MKIAVVGAGWYGCHLALALRRAGHKVTLLEAGPAPLCGAAGANVNRLHLGYHYPRSYATRMQSKDGYVRFLAAYPSLSATVPENYYAMASHGSLMDWETYRAVLASSGLDKQSMYKTPPDKTPPFLANVSDCLVCEERRVLHEDASAYFTRELGTDLVVDLRATVDKLRQDEAGVQLDGNWYDRVVNCTGDMGVNLDTCYEPCVLFLYEPKTRPGPRHAVTVVDGPFVTLYPYDEYRHSVYSVTHTPVGKYVGYGEARRAADKLGHDDHGARRAAVMQEMDRFYPGFSAAWRPAGVRISVRTRGTAASADRACSVREDGLVYRVMPGKIDAVFAAEDRLMSLLGDAYAEAA